MYCLITFYLTFCNHTIINCTYYESYICAVDGADLTLTTLSQHSYRSKLLQQLLHEKIRKDTHPVLQITMMIIK